MQVKIIIAKEDIKRLNMNWTINIINREFLNYSSINENEVKIQKEDSYFDLIELTKTSLDGEKFPWQSAIVLSRRICIETIKDFQFVTENHIQLPIEYETEGKIIVDLITRLKIPFLVCPMEESKDA